MKRNGNDSDDSEDEDVEDACLLTGEMSRSRSGGNRKQPKPISSSTEGGRDL